MIRRITTALLAILLSATGASAQDAGASPGDGGVAAPSSAAAQAELPQGHPPVGGSDPHGDLRAVLGPPSLARTEPSSSVPAGSIRVTVVDENGAPVPDAAVDVGVRSQTDDRTRHNARTDANGVVVFEGLPTGTGQAYRVNVPYLGATYSSSPFQLPTDRGYDVRITRLPVTRDERFVFFHLFRVIVEVRDERLHIIHQAELTNAGRQTFVFPADGLRVDLPEGATAFQAQQVMTDQRVEATPDGRGYLLRGSLPPGTTRLAWAYDLPIDDDTVRFPVGVPLRFFGLQVISQAPEGMVMDVSGMPDPQRIESEGQPLWVTQLRRGPTDSPIQRVTVTISGIPQPGPLRWIAVAIALVFVLGGVFMRAARADDPREAAKARARRREELLAEARALEEEFAAGEVGPQFRQTRRAEIVRELALLLHAEAASREKDSAPRSKPAARPAGSIR